MIGLNYKIVTPEKIYREDKADMVIIPSVDGDMGICENHLPILANLQTGYIEIYVNSKLVEKIFINSAVAKFSDNNLVILCEKIIDLNQVDIKKLKAEIISLENMQKSESDLERHKLQEKINSNNKILAALAA
ncbi:MAG: F0F1 ATP synthase subunit epsilon [Rickettsiales bacterium]|nr:F0F1 ATP synthase subunit epsilon [Rickettsiales bacterium]